MSTVSDPMPATRRIGRIAHASAPAPGFAGPGHTAVEVVRADALAETNPFVMLMDDRLDFRPGQPVGEPHRHAGLETVTLVLEGGLNDPVEGLLQEGDLAWMTAGRGVIHNEGLVATGRTRILQLWLMLPQAMRDSDPELQVVPLAKVPVRREPGVEARLYSGGAGTLQSPIRNRVPVTLMDFTLAPDAAVAQELPGTYTGFLYVIDGSIRIGDGVLAVGDVGWLSRDKREATGLRLQAGAAGARVVLYAGQPQDEPLVQRGPFVAGSQAGIAGYYSAYRAGAFRRLSEVAGRPVGALR